MSSSIDFCKNSHIKEQYISKQQRIAALLDKGVIIPCPDTIELGEDVDIERISHSTTIHTGCKIYGANTFIGKNSELGKEAPVCVDNCVIGENVILDGGYFQESTLLSHVEARSSAHVRKGCLLEEYSSIAHCVGLKQTILFPYVTLGSLINFCDCLMAGGRSRKDHSEVGSSYIHFNFTPRGDKATPSLFGDVAKGVLLNQDRIFLGGQSAVAGPIQVGYGSFLGPGNIYRRDVKNNRFLLGEKQSTLQLDFDPKILTGLRGKYKKNIFYIGQLIALWQWYNLIRMKFANGCEVILYHSAKDTISVAIKERVLQIKKLSEMIPESIARLKLNGASENAIEEQKSFVLMYNKLESVVDQYYELEGSNSLREEVLSEIDKHIIKGQYLGIIPKLPEGLHNNISLWLNSIVESFQSCAR